MTSYSENSNTPLAVVWKPFIYKIEPPEFFVLRVSTVFIKERTDHYVIQEITLEPYSGTKVRLVEKITCSPYWVPFSIIDHPRYSGPVDAIAERISSLETKITA